MMSCMFMSFGYQRIRISFLGEKHFSQVMKDRICLIQIEGQAGFLINFYSFGLTGVIRPQFGYRIFGIFKNKSLTENQKCSKQDRILIFLKLDLEKKDHDSTFATRFPKGESKFLLSSSR
jgi:hypothetical protein